MTAPNAQFEGVSGQLAAKVMARMNRDSELEAVEILAPRPSDAVLAIGIGPGVGVAALSARLTTGRAVGIDPSPSMLAEARRRNRAAVASGRVDLHRATASEIPGPACSFDGALAVNSIQMWDPIDRSLDELARVLRPGARLIALTHDWALERHSGSVDAWYATIEPVAVHCGFVDLASWRARAERGRAVVFAATKGPTR